MHSCEYNIKKINYRNRGDQRIIEIEVSVARFLETDYTKLIQNVNINLIYNRINGFVWNVYYNDFYIWYDTQKRLSRRTRLLIGSNISDVLMAVVCAK